MLIFVAKQTNRHGAFDVKEVLVVTSETYLLSFPTISQTFIH